MKILIHKIELFRSIFIKKLFELKKEIIAFKMGEEGIIKFNNFIDKIEPKLLKKLKKEIDNIK